GVVATHRPGKVDGPGGGVGGPTVDGEGPANVVVVAALAARALSPLEVARRVESGDEDIPPALASQRGRAEGSRPAEPSGRIDVVVAVRGQAGRHAVRSAAHAASHALRPERIAGGIQLDDEGVVR